LYFVFFFFQAEDGIRDRTVTGVQTCALPISYLKPVEEQKLVSFDFKGVTLSPLMSKERIIELRAVITREVFLHEALAKYIRRLRSEERRVGKEWRSGRWREAENKKGKR